MDWHGYSAIDVAKINYLEHHGVKGQKWGIKNGPPYPLNGVTVNDARRIATSINKKVENDRKPPTGNQNCKICTLCAEAQFRGIKNASPRPVYSPRDPEFEIEGPDFIVNPEYVRPKSFKDIVNTVSEVGDTGRFYCHINWNGSEGGHEFLIIKDKTGSYIMDPQAGEVAPLKQTDSHFNDADLSRTYLVRMDNKEFKEDLFHKVNDDKPLEFSYKEDIPYMYKEGILSKEEYEYAIKHPEEFDADKALLEET